MSAIVDMILHIGDVGPLTYNRPFQSSCQHLVNYFPSFRLRKTKFAPFRSLIFAIYLSY
jgi:hypothetical protein